MRKKDYGLVVALGILFSLALFSPKKILIADTFVVSKAQLQRGAAVYDRSCRRCHGSRRSAAPAPADSRAWEERLEKGIDRLTVPTDSCIAGSGGTLPQGEDFALATAYMIAVSHGKTERVVRRRAPRYRKTAASWRPGLRGGAAGAACVS